MEVPQGYVVQRSQSKDGSSSETSRCTIQCAYHGWEFDSNGSCTHVPQQQTAASSSSKVPPIESYPVRSDAGMIWVWTDPSTSAFADILSLPISPLLRRFHAAHGDDAIYMRDLPYGVELLGENLLDLSHLPFSHHSVGTLNRDIGGPLPLRMLSEQERECEAQWELEYAKHAAANDNGNNDNDKKENTAVVLPMFQVEVVDAPKHDPVFLGMKSRLTIPDNATCTIAFYDPCHVRYRRNIPGRGATHVELFMTPTSAGRSRVVLFNVMESFLPPLADASSTTTKKEKTMTLRTKIRTSLSPSAIKSKIQKKIVTRLFNPVSSRGHIMSHSIFDGDGIFLNKQGDRMRRFGVSYKNYSTPTTADLLVNAYRRYLDKAASLTEQEGLNMVSDVVSYNTNMDTTHGEREGGGGGGLHYVDVNDRPNLLDRYESHTKHCPICLADLAKLQKQHKYLNILQTAFIGAAGSSSTVFTAATTVSFLARSSVVATVPALLLTSSGLASIFTICGALLANRKKKKMDGKIQQFYFEDYVHAEKN